VIARCARHRHGLSALHAGAGHDGGGEPAAGRRQDAGRDRLEAPARRAEQFLASTPFRSTWTRARRNWRPARKQKLELLKQLYLKPRLLILDEPTSVLTPQEADEVLGHVRDFARSGLCTVLIITHKFREVMAYADDVTVLRRGRRCTQRRGHTAPRCWRSAWWASAERHDREQRPVHASRAVRCAGKVGKAANADHGCAGSQGAAGDGRPRRAGRARAEPGGLAPGEILASRACRATASASWWRPSSGSASAPSGQVHGDGPALCGARRRIIA
jgi:energy-coupling factor transporter ATP-binding protein EcfA2